MHSPFILRLVLAALCAVGFVASSPFVTIAADVSGTKFFDVTGNGISGDDVPFSGATIQLRADNGDGSFQLAGDR
jgi:hypothetical protein